MNKEEYIKRHGEAAYEKRQQRIQDWAVQHADEVKVHKRKYYLAHKAVFREHHRKWSKANPTKIKAKAERWHKKYPHYSRDYKRGRIKITDPLIFQFMDNGFDNDVDGFVGYLRSQNVSEQHISWFEKDVQKFIGDVET